MMDQPTFTVVIPTYNRKKTILTAINSVLTQTYTDFELIVVDDGSSDDTRSVVTGLGDLRIQYQWQPNGGGSKARNVGIDAARGKYIAFLDSDDKFLPNKLERVLHVTANHSADVYYSSIIVDRGLERMALKPARPAKSHEPIDEYLFSAGGTISTSTIVVKREIARSVRFLDGLKKGQDLDFVIKLFRHGAKFHFINEPLSVWSDYGVEGSVSHANHAEDMERWLHQNRGFMSRKAYYGFRCNVLSYELGQRNPVRAGWYIAAGMVMGGVPIKRALHSMVRAFVREKTYRAVVDSYISLRHDLRRQRSSR